MNTQITTRRVLNATNSAIITAEEIKELIGKTATKTAEFVQLVLADAGRCEDDGILRDANGKKLLSKSVKSPKQLIAFWEKHKLPVGALKRHCKAVWQVQPVKEVKVKAAKPAKTPKPKTAKPKATRKTAKTKTATILQIGDFRQGDLNLEVIAA